MPDDTSVALKALIEQVSALTATVTKQQADLDGIRKHNDRLLDEVKDAKRASKQPTIFDQERARKLDSLNLVQNPDGSTRLASGPTDHGNAVVLTREQARDPQQYREAKAAAAARGVPLRIADDGVDPTVRNTDRPTVVPSKTVSFDDQHERIRWVHADHQTGDGIVERRLAAEKDGYKVRVFRSPEDLPPHARQKWQLMEAAANAPQTD